jgi:hypothetical protein
MPDIRPRREGFGLARADQPHQKCRRIPQLFG